MILCSFLLGTKSGGGTHLRERVCELCKVGRVGVGGLVCGWDASGTNWGPAGCWEYNGGMSLDGDWWWGSAWIEQTHDALRKFTVSESRPIHLNRAFRKWPGMPALASRMGRSSPRVWHRGADWTADLVEMWGKSLQCKFHVVHLNVFVAPSVSEEIGARRWCEA